MRNLYVAHDPEELVRLQSVDDLYPMMLLFLSVIERGASV